MTAFQIHPSTVASSALSYNREEWQKGYLSLKEEYDYWIEDVEGEIPADLNGTLFRNGPGMLDINGHPIHHPFDGDGMVCAITFSNGRAHFRNRFVRTEGLSQNKRLGEFFTGAPLAHRNPVVGWLTHLICG